MRKVLALSVIALSLCLSTFNAATPAALPKSVMLDTRDYFDLQKTHQRQIDCLAINTYREAGIESDLGKLAATQLVINRVNSGLFPSTPCEVIKQRTQGVCQFSWLCKNRLPSIDQKIYNEIRQLATYVYLNHEKLHDVTKGALFYHADYVRPGWKRLKKTTKIGRHIFYKPIGEAKYGSNRSREEV